MRTFNQLIGLSLFSLSTNIFAATYSGELEVLSVDDFANKKSQTVYQLNQAGKVYKLNVPASMMKNLKTGNKIVVQGDETVQSTLNTAPGKAKDKEINVKKLNVTSTAPINTSPLSLSTDPANRNILILMVNYTNLKASTTLTPEMVDTMMFTGPVSADKSLRLSSFNQVGFIRDTNNDAKPDIFSVNLNYSITDCNNYNLIASDAKAAASKLGVNLANYKHFMFVIPRDLTCGWSGLGNIGCGTTCNTWIRAYEPTRGYANLIYTHELGHNLGMGHAANDLNNDGVSEGDYADHSCIMGNGPYPQVNSMHRDYLGWFAKYPSLITTASTGQYVISPLESDISNKNLRVIKVKRNATDTYYVSYRKNVAPFSLEAGYANKILIQKARAYDNKSYFVQALVPGQTFVDTVNNVKITPVSIAPDGSSATVRIN